MAIIRLDCNLNGGDSVTPNNELFYRIYGDVDAYASPIHTTGTALSDANVTVDNDRVIITGVDGTTNTEFKISAVDAAFNEGILSDAYDAALVFEDDFTGDLSGWNIINPDPTDIDFAITSEKFQVTTLTDGTQTEWKDNTAQAKLGIDITEIDSVSSFAFDLEWDVNDVSTGSTCICGVRSEDGQNGVWITRALTGTSECRVYRYTGGVSEQQGTVTATPYGVEEKYKMVFSEYTKIFYMHKWNGSAWVELTNFPYTFAPTDNMVSFMGQSSNEAPTSYQKLDNVHIYKSGYSTLRP